jgi:glutaryl-CoA dehydrogenase
MSKATFYWEDPLLLDRQLTDDERAAAAYAQERLAPRVLKAFRNEHTDTAIFAEMGELGLLEPTIPEAADRTQARRVLRCRYPGPDAVR